MELELERAFAATGSWARSFGFDDMHETWKKQICNASSWKEVLGFAGAVCQRP